MIAINLMDDEIIVAMRLRKEAFASSADFDVDRLVAPILMVESLTQPQGCAVVQPSTSLNLWAQISVRLPLREIYSDIRIAI